MSHCAPSWRASPKALLFKKYCKIIHLFPRSMSGLSLLLPLLPRERIYQSRACPLLSESKTGREYPYLAGRGAYLIGSRCPHGYWARFDRQNGPRDLDAVSVRGPTTNNPRSRFFGLTEASTRKPRRYRHCPFPKSGARRPDQLAQFDFPKSGYRSLERVLCRSFRNKNSN